MKKKYLLYLIMLFAMLINVMGCNDSDAGNIGNAYNSAEGAVDTADFENGEEYYANDEINPDRAVAESFAVLRVLDRSEEIVFSTIVRTIERENNSFEVVLRCLETDAIDKLIVYVENEKVIKYERDGVEHYMTDKDIAEDFAIDRIRSRTFAWHTLERTYEGEDGLYEVLMRRVATEEITYMLVLVIDGEVAAFEHDGRIYVRGTGGGFLFYRHMDENAEQED